uniref:NADH dehydrogenase [ubiquinone] 1 beta subcomplex subunit 7 n=1 Tax=Vombatus ursinus TaxID=29139 RepID=A0A4X2K0P3_VOMUR
MGAYLPQRYLWEVEVEPDLLHMPTFPLDYGFQGHKERVMAVTQQAMNDAQLLLQQWDYCTRCLIGLPKCKRGCFPNILACGRKQHVWDLCEHQHYVGQLKELEWKDCFDLQKKKVTFTFPHLLYTRANQLNILLPSPTFL